ncbi:MAG: hypothetical protein RIR70_1010 [Pseudomonadota bacterium]|jgi:dTDP-4-amino-4,6-dideoxygalactose transaminase
MLPFTRPTIDEATIADVAAVLRSGWLTTGPKCREFEAALSDFFGGRAVRLANSGTATLELALRLIDIRPGDEVITTPLTWVATANAIVNSGATLVLCDIDPVSKLIDLAAVERAITPRTRAIMPVDLAGLPVDRDALYALAKAHGLRVIEDAAQSMGSLWQGKRIGAFGDLVSFSFHANKNLTTGEGGCLVMNDDIEAERFERLRLAGVKRDQDGGMDVAEVGGKYNLTDIAAAIGLHQLRQLEDFNLRRRALAKRYFEILDPRLMGLPVADFAHSNWHMFQVLLPLERLTLSRGDVIRALRDRGFGVGVHYPALHLFAAYRARGFKAGDFPHAEWVGERTLTLPLFPTMTEADVDRVCSALCEILKSHLR